MHDNGEPLSEVNRGPQVSVFRGQSPCLACTAGNKIDVNSWNSHSQDNLAYYNGLGWHFWTSGPKMVTRASKSIYAAAAKP